MSDNEDLVAGVRLRRDAPTNLSFAEIFTWIIWQFPRKKGGGLLGAVRAPHSERGWMPAIVHAAEKRAEIHAHVTEVFESPEAAVEHLGSSS